MMFHRVYLFSERHCKDMILEIWGSSTKHPDCRFSYFDDIEERRYTQWAFAEQSDMENIYQWLCLCQSRLTFPSRELHQLIATAIKSCFTKC